MSQSIVEQLRNLRCFGPEHFELLREAADYIEQLEEENSALSAQNIQFAEDIEKLTDQLEANQALSDERAALMELCHIEIMANDKDQTTTSWVSPETPKRMLAALAQIQAAPRANLSDKNHVGQGLRLAEAIAKEQADKDSDAS